MRDSDPSVQGCIIELRDPIPCFEHRLSHPVVTLPEGAVAINSGAGVIESLTSTGPDGPLCSTFLLLGKVCSHHMFCRLESRHLDISRNLFTTIFRAGSNGAGCICSRLF